MIKWLRKNAKKIVLVSSVIVMGVLCIVCIPGVGVFIAGGYAAILMQGLAGVGIVAGAATGAGILTIGMESVLEHYEQLKKDQEDVHAELLLMQKKENNSNGNLADNSAEVRALSQSVSGAMANLVPMDQKISAQGKMLHTGMQLQIQSSNEMRATLDELPQKVAKILIQQGFFPQPHANNEPPSPLVQPNGAQLRERRVFSQGNEGGPQ